MAAKISAFADEIDADPKVQLSTLRGEQIKYIELRGAWGINVMNLSDAQCRELKSMFDGEGFKVSCIASPIGKVRLDENWDEHFDLFEKAVDLAEFFGCQYIRIFSYYAPEGKNIADFKDEVISRLRQQAEFVSSRPVTLVLENESDIYGDTPERCLELMQALEGKKVVMAFDPANFVSVGALPVYEKCWLPLRKYVGYFHMKDKASPAERKAVPVGQGAGDCKRILADAAEAGYEGFLAIEPHLSAAGQFGGFTGPDLFKVAARALKDLCEQVGLRTE